MERWFGKVAAITGAGSGIGAAVVVNLVNAGMIVVGLDLSEERIELSRQQFSPDAKGKLHAVKCDISKDDDVIKAFEWIESELGSVEVLVNCAGVSKPASGAITAEGNEEDLKQILQVNLWGMIMCIKKAVALMKRKNVVGAHIININSVLGHGIFDFPGLNVYPVSKYGVTALCEVLRNEFNADKLQYKITVSKHLNFFVKWFYKIM